MSEIEADLDRAAASYWLKVASKAGPDQSAALSRARGLIRDSRAESRIPDSAREPTLNDLEAPPLDVLNSRSRKR